MTMRFVHKLSLAAASGALVWAIVEYGDGISIAVDYLVPGALFAAAILWPYLDRKNRPLLRGGALVVASSASWYCAMWTVDYLFNHAAFSGPGLADFMAASLVGATIVFVAAKIIIPFRLSALYVSLGLVASVLGGWLFDVFNHSDGLVVGFVAWHCLMCTALHFGALPDRKMLGAHAGS